MKYTEVSAQRESADRSYSIWADPDIREIRKASCCMKTEKKSVSVCAERPHLGPEHGAVQLAGALLVPQLELQRSQSSWGIIAGRGRKQTTSMIHEGKHDYKPRINEHKRSKLLDLIESRQENRETCQAIRRWKSKTRRAHVPVTRSLPTKKRKHSQPCTCNRAHMLAQITRMIHTNTSLLT